MRRTYRCDPGAPIDIDRDAGPTIGDVGEFALIRAVTDELPTTADVLVGPGDDAAVVSAADGRVVVTTDMLVEGVHFRCDWSTAYDIGRKAAAQNLADVVAMGARPTALVLAFGAPPGVSVRWATELARGLADEASRAGAAIVGGDVVSNDRIVLGVTALGDLQGRAPVLRAGARPGNVVVATSWTGRSAAGLAVLRSGDASISERFASLVDAHRTPQPAYAVALDLARAGATAMIDVSDGLSSELHHLAAASGVAIDLEDVPYDEQVELAARALGVDPLSWQLHGGEDHAFLACVPPEVATSGREWRRIGYVTAGAGVTFAGRALLRDGWDHFAGDVSGATT